MISRGTLRHGNALRGNKRSGAYKAWCEMKTRCSNPNRKGWKNYGGRGIHVCERWATFENFLADMGERPKGMSLDRVDNNGNYEPGNCRWATQKEQVLNSRRIRMLTLNGETLTIWDWSCRLGIPPKTLYVRADKASDAASILKLNTIKRCLKCGFEWKSRTEQPVLCANRHCRNKNWNIPRTLTGKDRMTMTNFYDLLQVIKQVRAATLVHIEAEQDADIKEGMQINLDLMEQALKDAGWPLD